MEEPKKSKNEELAKTFKYCLVNIISSSLNTRKDVLSQLSHLVESEGTKLIFSGLLISLTLFFVVLISVVLN